MSLIIRRFAHVFTRNHDWYKINGKKVTIGISDYAISEVDITYIETPDVNEDVDKGSILITIEGVKSAEDIPSPDNCVVQAVHEELISNVDIMKDPSISSADKWIIKIETENPLNKNDFMSKDEYKTFLDTK